MAKGGPPTPTGAQSSTNQIHVDMRASVSKSRLEEDGEKYSEEEQEPREGAGLEGEGGAGVVP